MIVVTKSVLHCLGVFAVYVIPWLVILIPIRFLTKLPSYVSGSCCTLSPSAASR